MSSKIVRIPHPHNKLTAISVKRLGPGRHADGGGLYLEVDQSGVRRWMLAALRRASHTCRVVFQKPPFLQNAALSALKVCCAGRSCRPSFWSNVRFSKVIGNLLFKTARGVTIARVLL